MNREEAVRILKIEPTASHDQIRLAYRQLASQYHPDVGGTPEDFRKIHDAYEFLLTAKTRVPSVSTRHREPTENAAGEAAAPVNPLRIPAYLLIVSASTWLIYICLHVFEPLQNERPNVGTPVRILGILSDLQHNPMGLHFGLPFLYCPYIIFGSISMLRLRHRWIAMLAAILAMVPCLSPWFVLSVPAGYWAFTLLNEKSVQNQFDRGRISPLV